MDLEPELLHYQTSVQTNNLYNNDAMMIKYFHCLSN